MRSVFLGSHGAKESLEASLLIDFRKASEVVEILGLNLTELDGVFE